MGRNPLWKDMRWKEQDDITFFNIRIPRELRESIKEIADLEGTTISFLLRRELIALVRRKNREHGIQEVRLPERPYPGPKHNRPKRNFSRTKVVPETNEKERSDDGERAKTGILVREPAPESNILPTLEADIKKLFSHNYESELPY